MSPTIQNEPGAWDSDFSYGYLSRLYSALTRDFVPALLRDAADLLVPRRESAPRRVFIRHDIDVSLDHAVPLAALEASSGIASTYHVMLDSPFYDVRTPSSRSALAELRRLGHEVGLHYNVTARATRDASPERRERDIAAACSELEDALGHPVESLSFHWPVAELINGPLRVADRVCAYGAELLSWYLSDSRARWREGEPLESLTRPRAPNLQILVHPIWWGERHAAPADRLREFLRDVGPRLGRSYGDLNDTLWSHILHRAVDEQTTGEGLETHTRS